MFRVQQASKYCESGVWDWSMRIEPDGGSASLEDIRSVTYGLHPVFPNPNRVIRNPDNGFALEMRSAIAPDETWGRFEVQVTIVLKNGKRETHTEPLNLATPDDVVAHDLLPVPSDASFELTARYYGFLKRKGAYGYARQVLDQAEVRLNDELANGGGSEQLRKRQLWVNQQRAFCTYKDSSLSGETRLRDALTILEQHCGLNLTTCDEPETLGLGGAVCKRLWDGARSRANLELSLAYYRKGYEEMLRQPRHELYDIGAFTGANVVHVCELLALEVPENVDPAGRAARLAEADRVRQQLVRDLPALQAAQTRNGIPPWFITATLVEMYFGLACHDASYEAKLEEQANLLSLISVSPWELQSTGVQLLREAKLQKRLGRGSPAHIDRVLEKTVKVAFRGGVVVPRQGGLDGKLGLALSGGGFRASLFHIGVLARLADLNLLRHVEVISCVSGGSIVGAHYYLLLRKLLQEKADGAIDRDDYIRLVKDLLEQFLAGVQKNIRMRVLASWIGNIRMLFQPSHYSRTQRLGYLYEKHLYARVEDGEGGSERWLNEGFIVPKDRQGRYEDAFSPRVGNWLRESKVPMLVLNATTLNTGRNWQFTASFMGEPVSYGTTVDATERLDAVYFSEAPKKWRQFRLGEAVAASSCVPALFTPIVIPGLFEGRTVRLVDGGVHDNQGIRALLDQDCDLMLVSDASGQMESLPNPPHAEISVALRTNSVLQARVRVAQHQELQARVRAGQLRDCTFLHLRKELEASVQSAQGQPQAVASVKAPPAPGDTTTYGIERGVQRALASIRTDLDSFTDREALSLMCSGYKMAQKYLPDETAAATPDWRFFEVAQASGGVDQPDIPAKSLLRHLEAGSQLAFKIWHLHPVLNAIRIAFMAGVGIAVLAGLIYLVRRQVQIPLDGYHIDLGKISKNILIALAVIAAATVLPSAKAWLSRVKLALNPGSVAARIVVGLVMASVGWFVCRLHLWFFDWIFLRFGRVKR